VFKPQDIESRETDHLRDQAARKRKLWALQALQALISRIWPSFFLCCWLGAHIINNIFVEFLFVATSGVVGIPVTQKTRIVEQNCDLGRFIPYKHTAHSEDTKADMVGPADCVQLHHHLPRHFCGLYTGRHTHSRSNQVHRDHMTNGKMSRRRSGRRQHWSSLMRMSSMRSAPSITVSRMTHSILCELLVLRANTMRGMMHYYLLFANDLHHVTR
jgi:hypothetical protein